MTVFYHLTWRWILRTTTEWKTINRCCHCFCFLSRPATNWHAVMCASTGLEHDIWTNSDCSPLFAPHVIWSQKWRKLIKNIHDWMFYASEENLHVIKPTFWDCSEGSKKKEEHEYRNSDFLFFVGWRKVQVAVRLLVRIGELKWQKDSECGALGSQYGFLLWPLVCHFLYSYHTFLTASFFLRPGKWWIDETHFDASSYQPFFSFLFLFFFS